MKLFLLIVSIIYGKGTDGQNSHEYYGRFCGTFQESQAPGKQRYYNCRGVVWIAGPRKIFVTKFSFQPGFMETENITFWAGPADKTDDSVSDMFPSDNGFYLKPEIFRSQPLLPRTAEEQYIIAKRPSQTQIASVFTKSTDENGNINLSLFNLNDIIKKLKEGSSPKSDGETSPEPEPEPNPAPEPTRRKKRRKRQQTFGDRFLPPPAQILFPSSVDSHPQQAPTRSVSNNAAALLYFLQRWVPSLYIPQQTTTTPAPPLFSLNRGKFRLPSLERIFGISKPRLTTSTTSVSSSPSSTSSITTSTMTTTTTTATTTIEPTTVPDPTTQSSFNFAPITPSRVHLIVAGGTVTVPRSLLVHSHNLDKDPDTDLPISSHSKIGLDDGKIKQSTVVSSGFIPATTTEEPYPPMEPLSWYSGYQPLILNLPKERSMKDVHWLSIWDHSKKSSVTSMLIPNGPGFNIPEPLTLRGLKPALSFKDVRSGPIQILDAKTIRINDFYFEGDAPGAWFMVGKSIIPNYNQGQIIPFLRDHDGKFDCDYLKAYYNQTLTLKLPGNIKVNDIFWLSVFCVPYSVSFAHIYLPYADISVPPDFSGTTIPYCILEETL